MKMEMKMKTGMMQDGNWEDVTGRRSNG